MLERLIISKVRLKVLRTFLLNQESSYHIRALVRILEEEINAVRRELKNLELFGIITSKHQANKLVYSLNPDCIFINELKALFLKDDEEVKRINEVIGKLDKIESLIMTKSYIKKEYQSNEDIDMLLIGRPDMNKLAKEITKLEKELGRELRMAVLSPEDFDFKKKRRDKFLIDIMEGDKIVLIGDFTSICI